MEKNEILAGNKAIAEFMGWSFSKTGRTARLNAKDPRSSPYRLKDIQYNSQWNWLMPVIEKIESMGYLFMIVRNEAAVTCGRSSGLERPNCGGKADSKIQATYRCVLAFIEWYNKKQS